MGDKLNLTLVAEAQVFFRDLVTRALQNQKVLVKPETEVYLVNLLNQFISTESLYSKDSDGHLKEEPLVLLLKEATEQPQAQAQKLLFRHVGDVSLYVAGFFQESLTRKTVDVDYYIDIGKTAYREVAVRADENHLRSMYDELALKFASCVDVISEVSEKTTPAQKEQDLLRLYEIWLKTKSERAAKVLEKAGIVMDPNSKKNWQ